MPELVQLGLEVEEAVANARLELADRIGGSFHLLGGLLPGGIDVDAMQPSVCRRVAEARGAQHALAVLAIHYVLFAMAWAAALRIFTALAHVHDFVR